MNLAVPDAQGFPTVTRLTTNNFTLTDTNVLNEPIASVGYEVEGFFQNLGQPTWRPDGKVIAFTSNKFVVGDSIRNSDIYVISANGSGQPVNLTSGYRAPLALFNETTGAVTTTQIPSDERNPSFDIFGRIAFASNLDDNNFGAFDYTYVSSFQFGGPGFFNPSDPPRPKIEAQPVPTVNDLRNGSFETPQLDDNGPRFETNPNLPNQIWSFDGTSGIAKNGSSLGNPNAPDGNQVAFIDGVGGFSQSIYLKGAPLSISFRAAVAPDPVILDPAPEYEVTIFVGGVQQGGPILVNTATYATKQATIVVNGEGNRLVEIRATRTLGTSGRVFIDRVQLVGPEPKPAPAPAPTPDDGSPGTRLDTFGSDYDGDGDFDTLYYAGLNNYDIYIIKSDGTGVNGPEPTRITRDFRDGDRSIQQFNAPGKPRKDTQGNDVRVAPDGTSSYIVQNIQPSFSPNGTSLVFASNRRPVSDQDLFDIDPDNDFDLWRINADSRGYFQLTTDTPTRINAQSRLFLDNLRPSWGAATAATPGTGSAGASRGVNGASATATQAPKWDSIK
jgi:hypothetical protein